MIMTMMTRRKWMTLITRMIGYHSNYTRFITRFIPPPSVLMTEV